MKNYFIYTFLLICFGLIAQSNSKQEYVFDRLIQYEEDNMNQIQVYFNLNNLDYFLFLYDEPEQITARVFDKLNNKIHHYNVKPLQETNGLIYEYAYKSSEDLIETNPSMDEIEYLFEVTRDDKYYQFSKLNLFYTNQQDTPFLTADFTLRYHHENLFPAFNLCCLLGVDKLQGIETDDDFVVVRAEVMDAQGEKHSYRLVDDQVIQFKLNVPKSDK